MKQTIRFFLCFLFVSFGLTSSASAQMIVDHQAIAGEGQFDLTPALIFSEIEYEDDAEVERNILGLSFDYGVSDILDVYGEIGYIVEAELEGVSDDDDGLVLGGGVKGDLYNEDIYTVTGLAGIRYINEDYGDGFEGDVVEVQLNVTGRGQVSNELGLYLGIDIYPFSDGEVDFPGGDRDLDRDTIVGLRFGGDYQLEGSVRINLEAALVSEETLTLRATFPL